MGSEHLTLSELRILANDKCVANSIGHLVGAAVQNQTDKDDYIVVDRKTSKQKILDSEKQLNAKYAQQFNRNCFSQFQNLKDTRQSFFGLSATINSDQAVEPEDPGEPKKQENVVDTEQVS